MMVRLSFESDYGILRMPERLSGYLAWTPAPCHAHGALYFVRKRINQAGVSES